jgi:metal-responsive CopG/Arc/MetJ family transcriptional regulator
MSRKTKINVLLPFKMVGELETLSKLNKRSSFIESAIRNKLDGKDAFAARDIETHQLWGMLHHRAENNPMAQSLLMLVRELMLE